MSSCASRGGWPSASASTRRSNASPRQTNTVCALGGGTVRYAWNRDALRGTGLTIFLEADLATLAARVRAADRPRVNPGVSLEEDLAAIWAAAAPLYRDADLTYRTDAGRGEDEEVEDLVALVRGRCDSR